MNEEIDNILEGYHLKQYDLITVKQKLLVLFDVSGQLNLVQLAYKKGFDDGASEAASEIMSKV